MENNVEKIDERISVLCKWYEMAEMESTRKEIRDELQKLHNLKLSINIKLAYQ